MISHKDQDRAIWRKHKYKFSRQKNTKRKCIISLIMLDSVIRANKKYSPQTLLEECKYEIKKNKMENLMNDYLDLSSSDESDNEFDNGSDNGKSSD